MIKQSRRARVLPALYNAPVWLWLVVLNTFLLMNTAIFPHVGNDFLKWIVVNHFNLAGEMSFAAWWAGMQLLLVGLLALQRAGSEGNLRRAWLIMAAVFALLSFDEVGSLHERLPMVDGGMVVLVVLGVIGSLAFLYACRMLWLEDRRRVAVLLFLGVAMMGSAVVHEYFEHHIAWLQAFEGLRTAFEEGSELLGSVVCVFGLIGHRGVRDVADIMQNRSSYDLSRAQLAIVAGAGFVLHVLVAFTVTRFMEIEPRGNPAVWFFSATCFALSVRYLPAALQARNGRQATINLGLVVYLAALSALSVYFIMPRFNSKFHELGLLGEALMLLLLQLPVLASVHYLRHGHMSFRRVIVLLSLAGLLGSCWLVGGPLAIYTGAGLFAATLIWQLWPVENYQMFDVRVPVGEFMAGGE